MTQACVPSFSADALTFNRVVFAICPTGAYCREDRCQSFFKFDLIPTMRAPLEECEAAGAIKAAGGQAFIVDGPAAKLSPREYLSRVSALAPDLIVLVTTFGTLDADLAWAETFHHAIPSASIGVRGAPCYVFAEKILDSAPHVDFCVRGEYEIVFRDVVKLGYREAVGTVYRGSQKINALANVPRESNLDSLPRPDRSSLDPSLYSVRGLKEPQATIRVQRGCPYPCTYCLVHTVSGSEARHRSPSSIADEMRELIESGIRCFYLRAETFSLNRTWALEVCKAITERCPTAKWVTTTRVERVDDELLGAMKKAGCYGVSFGLDVASPTIAKHVKKLADPEIAAEAMRLCDKHQLISLAYLMVGFLWETEETLAETDRFIQSIRPDLLTIHFAHPYPGTKYHEQFVKEDKKVVSLRAQAEPAASTMGLSPEILRSRAKRMLVRHYSRPRVLGSLIKKGSSLLLARFLRSAAPQHEDHQSLSALAMIARRSEPQG